jgi:DNA-binding NtrC family response regulator
MIASVRRRAEFRQQGIVPMRAKSPSGIALVVEDEWLIREDIVQQLKSQGWEVLEASTAEGALCILKAEKSIGVLITDIQAGGLPERLGRC